MSLAQSRAFHVELLWSLATILPGATKSDASLPYVIPGVAMLALLSGVVL